MSTIRPLRNRRPSVPITAELYAATSDPVVVAFQLTACFYTVTTDPSLTLDGLRQRWHVGLPAARTARRTLIDLGYWAEVNTYTIEDEHGVKHTRPQRRTVTRTSEKLMTGDDLHDLAAEYPAGTRIECGHVHYVIDPEGRLVLAGDTDGEKSAPRSAARRGAEISRPVPPAETATGMQKPHGRSDLGERAVSAGGTARQAAAPHASSLRDDDQAYMDAFWELINTTARVDPPGRRAVRHHVATALSTGWTAPALAEWVIRQLRAASDRSRISNRGGFVVSRLKEIPPPTDHAAPKPGTPAPPMSLPACDVCGAAEGAPLARRMTVASDGRLRRCDCRGAPAVGLATSTPIDQPDRGHDTAVGPTHASDPMTELDLTTQRRSGPHDPGDE